MVWVRRWCKTSKPTEWISSTTGLLTVLATVVGAYIVVSNGLFDQKKSELAVQGWKLEVDQKKLLEERDALFKRSAEDEAKARAKDAAFLEAQRQLMEERRKAQAAGAELTNSKQLLQSYSENEKAIAYLTKFKKNENQSIPPTVWCHLSLDSESDTMMLEVTGTGRTASPLKSQDKSGIVNAIQGVRRLKYLRFYGVQLDPDDLPGLCKIPSLRELTLENCGLTNAHVNKMVIDKNINYLNLNNNPTGRLPEIKHAWAIQTLLLDNTGIGDHEVRDLLKDAINLYALHVSGTPIGDHGIELWKHGQTTIDNVEMIGSKVTPKGAMELIRRTHVRWVMMSKYEAEAEAMNRFLAENSLKSRVVMYENDPDKPREEKVPLLAFGTNDSPVYNFADPNCPGVIRARPWEYVTITYRPMK